MKQTIYPYKFVVESKERVWGGNTLELRYGKPSKGDRIGETWEICGFEDDSSVIANGYLAENSLFDVIETYMDEIVGEDNYKRFGNEFPLLMKMLDIEDRLSIQVHPNDDTAFDRHNSYGKTEAWYVLDAKPGAKVYMGFNRDITPVEFLQRASDGTLEEVLNVYEPKKGDFFFIESGIVHAAGGGVVIAEVQQLSDVTYRIYDWGREFDPQTAREMHVELAIDCINYKKYDESKYFISGSAHHHGSLVKSKYFNVTPFRTKDTIHIYTEQYNSFIVYFCAEGEAAIKMKSDGVEQQFPIAQGEWVLIPASAPDFYITPINGEMNILEFYIEPQQEVDSYIND